MTKRLMFENNFSTAPFLYSRLWFVIVVSRKRRLEKLNGMPGFVRVFYHPQLHHTGQLIAKTELIKNPHHFGRHHAKEPQDLFPTTA